MIIYLSMFYMKDQELRERVNKEGFVYIYTNGNSKNGFKIGKANNISRREGELNTSAPNGKMLFAVKVDNDKLIESVIHQMFYEKRVDNDKEFFKIKLEAILPFLLFVAKGFDLRDVDFGHKIIQEIENNKEGLYLNIIKNDKEKFNNLMDVFEEKNCTSKIIKQWIGKNNKRLYNDKKQIKHNETEQKDNNIKIDYATLCDAYNLWNKKLYFVKNKNDFCILRKSDNGRYCYYDGELKSFSEMAKYFAKKNGLNEESYRQGTNGLTPEGFENKNLYQIFNEFKNK